MSLAIRSTIALTQRTTTSLVPHLTPRSSNPSTPSLSPAAIVGLSIIGALFFCVAAASMLKFCSRSPSAEEEEKARHSLYRPDCEAQLEHMKEVRESNRLAMQEKADLARFEIGVEKGVMGKRGKRGRRGTGLGFGSGMGSGSGSASTERESRGWEDAEVYPGPGFRSGVGTNVRGRPRSALRDLEVGAMELRGPSGYDERQHSPFPMFRGELGGPRDYSDGAYTSTADDGESGGPSSSGSEGKGKGRARGKALNLIGHRATYPAAGPGVGSVGPGVRGGAFGYAQVVDD
jgi:hypothetical protein